MEEMEDHEDVQSVSSNFDIDDEVMAHSAQSFDRCHRPAALTSEVSRGDRARRAVEVGDAGNRSGPGERGNRVRSSRAARRHYQPHRGGHDSRWTARARYGSLPFTTQLIEVIDEHTPDAMSLERSFVAVNVQSAFTPRRGARDGDAGRRRIADSNLFEYTPTDVKLSIAGYGRADKAQVKDMVRRTLGRTLPDDLADDAADALAIALCHLPREDAAAAGRRKSLPAGSALQSRSPE